MVPKPPIIPSQSTVQSPPTTPKRNFQFQPMASPSPTPKPPEPPKIATPLTPPGISLSAPDLKISPPTPMPPPGQPPVVFKSSIRTMQEDIAALKKGGAPAGFQIEKQLEEARPVVRPPISNSIPQPQTFSHVELGKLEKSRPLPSAIIPPLTTPKIPPLTPPPFGLAKPTISIPLTGGIFGRFNNPNYKKIIMYVIAGFVGFIITAYLIPYFASSPDKSVSPTPTTSTPVVTLGIKGFFSVFSEVSIGVGADIFENLVLKVNKNALAGGEPGLYKIINPQNSLSYSFGSFMSSALVTIPEEIIPFVDNDKFYVSLMQKTDNSYSRGFIVKLKNDVGISEVLNRWETNMSTNLETLFDLGIEQAASVNFLDNSYLGVAIRYRNFPDHFLTIDYAVITEASGEKYLVVTSSREHMYAIIDNLK